MTPRDDDRLPDDWTLGQARDWLRARVKKGAKCPCCTQFAKIYPRNITGTAARCLVGVFLAGGARDFVHAPSALEAAGVRYQGGDFAKLRHWGLLEEEHRLREDGGRAGFWRVTPAGVAWLAGRTTVPKYAWLYDGNLQGREGEAVSIHDALGERFNLRELMSGPGVDDEHAA